MTAALSIPPHSLSIVVPFYNEEDNIAPLVKRVHEALAGYQHPWELVLVDDGSSDATVDRAMQCVREYGPHVRIVELTRNFKQTAAMQAGLDAARGDVIVTMDGDLQNDPVDIPRMVARLLNEDLDLVAGWRQEPPGRPVPAQDSVQDRQPPDRPHDRASSCATTAAA